MVGYRADDPMSTTQKLIAGVISGVITRFVTQPMDVIKVRAQLIKKPRKTTLLRELQVKFFGKKVSRLSGMDMDWVRRFVNFLCGVCAGCVSTTLVIPLEVIRVRQILVHDQYKGVFHGAKNVYKTGGVLAFYEGLSASLLQTGPAVGISFTTFRLMQKLILGLFEVDNRPELSDGNRSKPKNLMIASTLAGSIAGFVSKTLTYPFDLIKRRLQIGSHVTNKKYKIPSQVAQLAQCTRLSQCFVQCYKKEGLRGFFRGWTVTIFKAQLTSVVAFTSYEMLCLLIREIHV